MLRGINSKLERLDVKFGQVVGLLERIAKDQAQLCSLLACQTPPSFTTQSACLFPSTSYHLIILPTQISSMSQLMYAVVPFM